MSLFDIRTLGQLVYSAGRGGNAEIVVLIPLYNYMKEVIDALESVVRQDINNVSLIVIDDCSTDDGLKETVSFLERYAFRFTRAQVVRHKRNQGLSMARNSGLAWSSEPYVFMLDADNRIRPPALSRLRDALQHSGADFAYPQLVMFDRKTDIGVGDIWDPAKLLAGNYIDAMSLIRREALIAAGGYAVLADDHGWEDFDLWCHFADLGMKGVFLPELLGEYRVHGNSMTRTSTQVYERALFSEMKLRHPNLLSRHAVSPAPAAKDRTSRTVAPDTRSVIEVGQPAGSPPTLAGRTIDFDQWQKEITLSPAPVITMVRPLGIFVHLYYEDLAEEIAQHLACIDFPKKIYISTGDVRKQRYIQYIFEKHGLGSEIQIEIVPDYGTDIAPFLITFSGKFAEHDICLKIHSKRSYHGDPGFGEGWRTHLYRELMGDSERVSSIVAAMLANPDIGVLMPSHWHGVRQWLGVGVNREPMLRVLSKIGVDLLPDQHIEYPSGSMFWFRGDALADLARLGFDWDEFGRAVDRRDNTLQHGVERCFLFFCVQAGKKWAFLPSPLAPELSRDETIRMIRDSGLFDDEFYRATNPDVQDEPLTHWLDHGAKEGRDPSPSFLMHYYKWMIPEHYPNALVHYILEGRRRSLRTMPQPKGE